MRVRVRVRVRFAFEFGRSAPLVKHCRLCRAQYMGQVSQWINDFLGVRVSIEDVMRDRHTAGAHHTPANFRSVCKDFAFPDDIV